MAAESIFEVEPCPECGEQAVTEYRQVRAWGGEIVRKWRYRVHCNNRDCVPVAQHG